MHSSHNKLIVMLTSSDSKTTHQAPQAFPGDILIISATFLGILIYTFNLTHQYTMHEGKYK